MCGIFAYLNYGRKRSRKEIVNFLLNGLKRLEYRGYDSAGLAIDNLVVKQTGKVINLEKECEIELGKLNDEKTFYLNNHLGIAHTRWATHGPPSPENSHPHHSNKTKDFLIVHNGIITNFQALKDFLISKGYGDFASQTDTEVIAKLTQYFYDKEVRENNGEKPIFQALVTEVLALLEGAFALIFKSKHYPNQVVATRRGSPLLMGIKKSDLTKMPATRSGSTSVEALSIELNNENTPHKRRNQSRVRALTLDLEFEELEVQTDTGRGSQKNSISENNIDYENETTLVNQKSTEYFFASDMSAIIEHTKRIIFLEDSDILSIENNGCPPVIYNTTTGGAGIRKIENVKLELDQIMKGGYQFFMEKEIMEQPDSVINTMRGRVDFDKKTVTLGGIVDHVREIRRCRRLIFIACGTSFHSAMATRQIVEELVELPVMVEVASDFLDRECPIFRDDVCIFISQSGETADSLMALRYCKKNGAFCVGITNVVGSSISRETDCGVHINAGPEIGVASTKAYTSQFITVILFAIMLSSNDKEKQERHNSIIDGLKALTENIKKVLQQADKIKELSLQMKESPSILVMGRGYNSATCLEGALKIKELTYLHSEGIQSGELKHGPLALIDDKMPIVMIIAQDNVHQRCLNALQQVIARGGRPLVICQDDDPNFKEGAPMLDSIIDTIKLPRVVDCVFGILSVIPLRGWGDLLKRISTNPYFFF